MLLWIAQAGPTECPQLLLLVVEDLRANHAWLNQKQGQSCQEPPGTRFTATNPVIKSSHILSHCLLAPSRLESSAPFMVSCGCP